MILSRKIAVSVVVSLFALPAHAFEKLLGEYEGKIGKVEGSYRGKKGDACTAKLTKSDRASGSVSFAINNEEPIYFSTGDVSSALAAGGGSLVELLNKAAKGFKAVNMQMREDGSVKSLSLRDKAHMREINPIACSDLTKK
jgi:hypothetical protein